MPRLLRFFAVLCLMSARLAFAQSPELSMREFASGQVKKGVRSIGFGGDGATWGNYGLVYREHDTAVLDVAATGYTNGNVFGFTAVGITTPQLWHGLAIYVLAMGQNATGIHLSLHDDALGPNALAAHGDGGDELLAFRIAMPLGHGFNLGIQLTYEVSHFDALLDEQAGAIRYRTEWRPSGGIGLAWMPSNRLLIGTRVILNHDQELRTDAAGTKEGLYRNYEYRVGISFSPWRGALFDAGGTLLDRSNAVAGGAESIVGGANLGFEQAFWKRALVLRAGVDECQLGLGPDCSPTAGLSVRAGPLNLDLAYVYNLGQARIGTLFGDRSHTVLATLTFSWAWFERRRLNVQSAPVARRESLPAAGRAPVPPPGGAPVPAPASAPVPPPSTVDGARTAPQ